MVLQQNSYCNIIYCTVCTYVHICIVLFCATKQYRAVLYLVHGDAAAGEGPADREDEEGDQ